MQVDQHGGRALVVERVVDDDRRLGGERAAEPAMRQESGRRQLPELPVELGGRRVAGGEHAHAAVLRPGLGDQPRRDLERLAQCV